MPPSRARLFIAIGIAAVAGALAYQVAGVLGVISDLDQSLYASRVLLDGRSPYPLIGPERPYPWPWRYPYPLAGPILVTPFALLGDVWGRVLYVAAGSGVLAFLLTRRSYVPLFVFASGPYLMAVRLAQWSPWMAAAMLSPALGWIVFAKPNLGLVAMAGMRRRGWVVAVAGSLALLVASFLVLPSWLTEWREAVASIPVYNPLLFRPGGVVMLLALARWRRWDARVLLASALVPGSPSLYDAFLPFCAVMIAAGRREAMTLSLISFLGLLLSFTIGPRYPDEQGTIQSVVTLGTVHVPLLAAVLRRPAVHPHGSRRYAYATVE